MFGNSEIQFKLGSDILELNIGHQYRSFDTGIHKDSLVLTGSVDKECKIREYEIYQIMFNEYDK
jgi:hypothetical protein